MQDRFTLYDIFAVLVPGVIFMYLLAFTLDRAVGVELFDWTGGIGDATLLLIFGYAAGALLQALGNATIERLWRRLRGGQPTATLLTPGSTTLDASTKRSVLEALDNSYGKVSVDTNSKEYRKLLEDRTYRAWKAIAPDDPQAQRFFAEVHAMRAFTVTFFLLAVVALAGGGLYGDEDMSWRTHGTLTLAYVLLFATSLWRMENKAVTFARHVLTAFVGKVDDRKGQGGQP